MARLNFPDWRPDADDLNGGTTRVLRNVIPRVDGYGPAKDLQSFTGALPAACRGYFVARRTDSSLAIFAGTINNLYLLSNTTLEWTEVSKGGADYSDLASDSNWSFVQFGDIVIAAQRNSVMQSYDLTSSSAFDDLAGSPPQAGWVGVVGPFIVACDLLSEPYRIQWSGQDAITTWTSGTTYSDFQDLPDGGRVRGVAEMGPGLGIIVQDGAARRMTWSPGSAAVFQIDRLSDCPGILAPYSLCVTKGGAYYFSTQGMISVDASGAINPIGEERVNRTLMGSHAESAPEDVRELACDLDLLRLMIGAPDPETSTIVWVYKSDSSTNEWFDRAIVYHTTLRQWAPTEVVGEYIAPLAIPGLTLEGLDSIAPGALTVTGAANNGSGLIRLTVADTSSLSTGDVKAVQSVGGVPNATGNWTITVISGTTLDLQGSTWGGLYTSGGTIGGSVDGLTFPWDSISTASLPNISAVNTSHKICVFIGDTLEAVMETPEQSLEGRRMGVNGVWPVTDADDVYASVRTRDKLNGAWTDGTESGMNDDGFCPLLDEGRYVRGKIRIPAGTTWTFATGIEPEAFPLGRA